MTGSSQTATSIASRRFVAPISSRLGTSWPPPNMLRNAHTSPTSPPSPPLPPPSERAGTAASISSTPRKQHSHGTRLPRWHTSLISFSPSPFSDLLKSPPPIKLSVTHSMPVCSAISFTSSVLPVPGGPLEQHAPGRAVVGSQGRKEVLLLFKCGRLLAYLTDLTSRRRSPYQQRSQNQTTTCTWENR